MSKPSDTVARIRQAELVLLTAAIVYEHETENSGPDPMRAGARLRLAAKAYAKTAREAGVLP